MQTIDSQRNYLPRRVALRWRLDYAGCRPLFGAWSSDVVLAWPHTGKPNLIRATIEASDLVTGEVRPLANCPGSEWLEFRWIRAVGLPIAQLQAGPKGAPIKVSGAIHGLTIVTQLEMAHVFIDGSAKREPNRAWRKP